MKKQQKSRYFISYFWDTTLVKSKTQTEQGAPWSFHLIGVNMMDVERKGRMIICIQ